MRDILIITLFSFLENIFYRQWLSIIRAIAFLDFVKGKEEWGAMEKKDSPVQPRHEEKKP